MCEVMMHDLGVMSAQGKADMLQKMVGGHEPKLFEKPLAMSES
jgi:hypothetical protein